MGCSFITINVLIISTICILVAFTCSGVSLGLTVQILNGIGRGYAKSIITGLHSSTLKYFVDVEAMLMSADRHAKINAPLSPSHVVGRNWTDDWIPYCMNVFARRNFSISSFNLVFLDDLFWTAAGRSGDRPKDAFFFEWFEDLGKVGRAAATDDDISIGATRWVIQNDHTITRDYTLTVAESYPRKFPRRPSVSAQFDQLLNVLKNRKTDPGCQWLGNNHVKNSDIGVYWALIGACTMRNSTNHLIALSIGAIDAVSELAVLLRTVSKSPNGHNFILDQSGLMLASTHPEPVFTSVATTKTAPVPRHCSSTEIINPGKWDPPWLGCRFTPATFPYAPLNALSPEMYGTTTESIVEVRTSEGGFLIACRQVQTKFGGIILNVITVIPFKDIYGDGITGAIGLSFGLAVVVAIAAIAGMWMVLAQVLSGLAVLQKEMEDAAALIQSEDGTDEKGDNQQQQQEQRHRESSAAVSGWATVFGAIHDEELDISRLDDPTTLSDLKETTRQSLLSDEAVGTAAAEAAGEGEGEGAPAAAAGAGGIEISDENTIEMKPLTPPTANIARQRKQDDYHKAPERQSGGSIITEIAAVELAYKTAIAALRKSSAFVPRQLLAAELLHQRRLAKASALAADKSGDHDLQRIATTKSTLELACSIPAASNQISILMIQLEQMAEVNKLATLGPHAEAAAAAEIIQAATDLLQSYFKKVTRCVMSHGGIVHSFSGSGGEESAIMASWGAPIQREDHSVLAVLCALAIQREMAKEDGQIRALCARLFSQRETAAAAKTAAIGAGATITAIATEEIAVTAADAPSAHLRVRIAVASGTALSGCVRDGCGQIHYNLVGGPVAAATRLLAAAKRWQVRSMVEENAAKACDGILKFRALCLAKIKHTDGVSFVYEPIGVDCQSEVVQSVQRGKLARDAIVAAQRRNLRRRAHGSNNDSINSHSLSHNTVNLSPFSHALRLSAAGASDSSEHDDDDKHDEAQRENASDTDSAAYRRVVRHVYGAVGSGAGGGGSSGAAAAAATGDDDFTAVSSVNQHGAASLRLSEAMSAGTLHASDNRALAEVLVPNAASVERLLRWHADKRTTVDAESSRYAEEFTFAARDVVCLNFAGAASRIRNILDNDELFPPRVKAGDGALKYLSSLVEMFKDAPYIHPRNLHRVDTGTHPVCYLCDQMRGNPDAKPV